MIITEPTTPLIFMRNPVGLFIYGVFFADLAGAAGSVFGFVAVAFYGLCGIYGYGVGRVGIAGRVGTGDGLCYAHAGD